MASLRTRFVAAVLASSLLSVLLVGGFAYWKLMRQFSDLQRERAFSIFQDDVRAYVSTYGSLEQAIATEEFPDFIRRRTIVQGQDRPGFLRDGRPLAPPPPPPGGPDDEAGFAPGPPGEDMRPLPPGPPDGHGPNPAGDKSPPFGFMLFDVEGRVLLHPPDQPPGQLAPREAREDAIPIIVNGQTVGWASSVGGIHLSEGDRNYLSLMRESLGYGVAAATLMALVLGIAFGNRLCRELRHLTEAARRMEAGEIRQRVAVNSRDEVGELAASFNRMSAELAVTLEQLEASNRRIREQARELKEQSIRDPLTQLYNRRYFDEQATKLYAQAMRHGQPLIVLIADIDRFKSINDTLSHAVGDRVIQQVAAILKANVRGSDLVARYGGEEFVVALTETEGQNAVARCETLRTRIEEFPWHEIHPSLRVTISIGLNGDLSGGSFHKMLERADASLHRAKNGGRNRVCA